jgi:methyl-accepting chemotaxis protein
MAPTSLLRKRSEHQLDHPALTTVEGLRALIEQAPTPIFLTDSTGAIVYRNAAALATMNAAVADIGDVGMRELRQKLVEVMRTASRYPDTCRIEVTAGGQSVVADCQISDVPGGLAVTWRNVTREREHQNVTRSVAEDVTRVSGDLLRVGGELDDATVTVSEQSARLATAAGELIDSIREISAGATAAAHNADEAARITTDASNRMAALVASTEEIASIADLISGIAEQTNLLALNARIEAARAGEVGAGFAVVAGEVKDLARRTSEATEHIRTLVEAAQTETGGANEAIARLVELIGAVAHRQTTIASAVEEQSAVADQMGQGIAQVADGCRDAAQAAEATLGTVGELTSSASRLRELLD